ncbi:hypothetical protein [Streptomyces sp. NPDC094049]|uniref:hypothetical protein n=1 Tax=Streptomyces sp. NPDC094049 TaxID=3154987 RepID=UPI0033206AB1
MSDKHEQDLNAISGPLGSCYLVIAKVCAHLPIPIELPVGIVLDSAVAVPAVVRVTELIQDQPVDEEVQSALFSACLFWLASVKLFSRFTAIKDDPTAGVEIELILLVASDALSVAIDGLREEESPEEEGDDKE